MAFLRAPRDYARGAIKASVELLADPNHAKWVKDYWGERYLERQNLFYRLMIIAGLTSELNLLGESSYPSLLRQQFERLRLELDESPSGLLDDYPGECFPADVAAAVAAIRQAGHALGIDTSVFVERSLRGFTSAGSAGPARLPSYMAGSDDGRSRGPARGSTSGYLLVWAPELWKEAANEWYLGYEKRFWQRNWFMSGFREFPNDQDWPNWYWDVDSGPVISGAGVGASAFGVAAARVNGRFDHAFPLAAQMLALSWPLLDGTLVIPRALSAAGARLSVAAPYAGEAAILFCLTRRTASGLGETQGGGLLGCVFITLAAYVGLGALLAVLAVRQLSRRRAWQPVPHPRLQFAVWAALILAGLALGLLWRPGVGIVLILGAQLVPRGGRRSGTAVQSATHIVS